MSFERRFSAIGKGLPGVVGFDLRDLSDGDMPRWNATTEKWELDSFQDVVLNTRQIIAGDGLSGGGALSSDVTLDVDILGIEDLSDPGADRILFWDDSAGAFAWLEVGSGLTLSGTTLSVDAGSSTLAGLDDTDISGSQATGVVLYWDGGDWTDTDSLRISPSAGGIKLKRPGGTIAEIISNVAGDLIMNQRSAGDSFEDTWIASRYNGAVELYYDGSKKLETTSTGITVTGSVQETSDSRLKSDRAPISGALNAVLSLRGETYEMSGRRASGLIAQDIRRHMPEAVSSTMYQDGDDGENEEVLTYSPSAVLAYVIEALREIDQRTKALEERDTRENSQ